MNKGVLLIKRTLLLFFALTITILISFFLLKVFFSVNIDYNVFSYIFNIYLITNNIYLLFVFAKNNIKTTSGNQYTLFIKPNITKMLIFSLLTLLYFNKNIGYSYFYSEIIMLVIIYIISSYIGSRIFDIAVFC